MNSQSELAGYSSTEDFIAALQKHMKIIKTCDSAHLTDCFASEVLFGVDANETDISQISKATHFGKTDWGTNLVGIQTANGVNAIFAYNPKCVQDPFSNTNILMSSTWTSKKSPGLLSGLVGDGESAVECYAVLYDVNGFSSPNKSLHDMNSVNISKLGRNCAFVLDNGTCLKAPQAIAAAMSQAQCNQLKSELGLDTCNWSTDYYAAAAQYCGGVSNMANNDDLARIANEIYGVSYIQGRTDNTYGVTQNAEIAKKYFGTSGEFCVWSEQSTGGQVGKANYRCFGTNYTLWRGNGWRSDVGKYVFCKGE